VDKNDPSIKDPSKYVGTRYSEEEANSFAEKFGWNIKEQESGQWRRVVPSPMPEYIMHGNSIKTLVDRGTIVIASGGGGIPVYNNEEGHLEGLDAVIDNVYLNYGKENQESLLILSASDAEKLYEKGEFQQGSIGPKIKAAMHFLKYHGEKVIITSIPCIQAALDGKAGTEIRNEK
jgi:carbamate kinase